MSLEMCMYELRDIADRHNLLTTGIGLMAGQRVFWTHPEAAMLYDAIQADGQPRISELRSHIATSRQRTPDYTMYAAAGQPSMWPYQGQAKLMLGYVQFRPGWPAPNGADREAWSLQAKVAAQTEITPEKATQIAKARSQTMGFLNGVSG